MRLLTFITGNKIIVPLSCIAAVAMLVTNELSYTYSTRYRLESFATVRSQTLLNDLSIRLLKAKAEQRAFLLTGRTEYLQPYRQAIAPVRQTIRSLQERYQKNAASLALVEEFDLLFSKALQHIEQSADVKKMSLSDVTLNHVLIDDSNQNMQRMKEITTTLLEIESTRVFNSRNKLQLTQMISRGSITLLSVMCLVAILIYLQRNMRLNAKQLQLRDELTSELDQMGVTLEKRTQELTQLARYLQNTREEERSRLGRDLHDELGALLTSAKLDTARIKARVGQQSPQLTELLAHLTGNLNGSIALGRKIIEDLRPSALNNLGLIPTLEIFANELKGSSGLVVHTHFETIHLPPDSQLMIYRLMQEACTNIVKYANAANVWLSLELKEGVIMASVRDDGVGFDTDKQISSSFGLLGMRYRVEAVNGVLNIISSPGEGTLVQALL